MVQCRWGHENYDHSLFTRLQAIGHDGHFVVEQHAKNVGGVGGASALVTFICVLFVLLLRWCECSCHVHFCSLHSAHANPTIHLQLRSFLHIVPLFNFDGTAGVWRKQCIA
jgi:hypothetical protein